MTMECVKLETASTVFDLSAHSALNVFKMAECLTIKVNT